MKLTTSYRSVNQNYMGTLRRDVSLLRNLVTFEASCRSKNFTRAAEELGMTRVAVSRQIAELEQNLGARLFKRNHRDVGLTDAGRTLAASVNPALLSISQAIQGIRNGHSTSRLSITTTSAFATYWLMPRLIGFGALHPEIEINLVVTDKYLDLAAEGIDIAIRYGRVDCPGAKISRLFRELIIPVYSPKYKANRALRQAADLRHERLLHLSGTVRPEARWPHWFRLNGIRSEAEPTGMLVNTYINMLQATVEGQGIGLACVPLVNSFLNDGTLKTIAGVPPVEGDLFYLIDRSNGMAAAAAFCKWISEEAKEGVPSLGIKGRGAAKAGSRRQSQLQSIRRGRHSSAEPRTAGR